MFRTGLRLFKNIDQCTRWFIQYLWCLTQIIWNEVFHPFDQSNNKRCYKRWTFFFFLHDPETGGFCWMSYVSIVDWEVHQDPFNHQSLWRIHKTVKLTTKGILIISVEIRLSKTENSQTHFDTVQLNGKTFIPFKV